MNRRFFALLLVVLLFFFGVGFYISSFTTHRSTQVKERTLYLLAERDGEVMNWREFRNETEEVYFFTDSKWRHREGEIRGEFVSEFDVEIPVLEVPKRNTTLNLLWEVPGFGKVVLRLDLGDYEENETIHLNEELAKEKHGKLVEKYNDVGSETAEGNISDFLEKSESHIQEGSYLKSLNKSLWGLEKLTLLKAEENIEDKRKEVHRVEVLDGEEGPVENATVEYTIEKHDFEFGWSSPRPDEELAKKMKDLGFNTYQQFSFLHQTQPKRGLWDFKRQKSRIKTTDSFHQSVAGLISDPSPYWSNISDNELAEEVDKHVSRTIEKLEGISNVSRWECYGFGMHYMADQTLHITTNRSKGTNINTTLTCIETIKEEGNDDVVVTGWNIDGSEIWNESYSNEPYTYYENLDEDFDIAFDFMYFGGAHEMYPDLVEEDIYRQEAVNQTRKNWIPARSLYSISEMLDWYSTLEKDIHIQYFQAPSNYLEDHRGYWKEPWDEEIQAEWIENYYTLIYSKPYIESINYLEPTDSDWKDLETGIIEQNGTLKKSYSSLERLIGSWESDGTTKTNSQGMAQFQGYDGSYEITVTRNNESVSKVMHGSNTTVKLN